jgi:pilus assembly protein CpaB
MKIRPLLLGVAVALLGVVLQYLYMRRFEAEASGGAKIELLVAAQPIERGNPITKEMVGVREVPQAYVDDRAIRAVDREKILGLIAASNVPVLQTLAWTDLIAHTDDQRDLSALVQPGNRAMPVRIQFEESLQLIRPGDFVDLLSVDPDGRGSIVLLQRVLVLAAGLETSIQRTQDKKPALRATILTVSVSLQEAQLLSLAQATSRLTVVIRNTADPRITEAPPDLTRAQLVDATVRQNLQARSRRPVRLEAGGHAR